jgi:hypothetical protein
MKAYYMVLAVLIAISFMVECAISSPSAQPAQLMNQSTIPNLTGKWNTESFGSVMPKSSILSEWTHHKDRYSHLIGQAVITDQQGRVLHGMFMAPLGKNESFIAVIGMDNSSMYLADQDGFQDLQIIDNDLMTGVYRHITANDTVVAAGTWTRAKE